MTTQTRISVAMAVYNGELFIQEQLDSFVRQTRLPDELVISDNCSTDGTVEIVREFAAHAPFPVRLFINELNLGVSKNFERAIGECTGDIIFLSDCDDIWYPDKIRAMNVALHSDPSVGIALCDADLVNEFLTPLGRTAWEKLGRQLSRRQIRKIADGKPVHISQAFLTQGNCLAFRSELRQFLLPLPEGGRFQRGWHDYFIAWTIVYSGIAGVCVVAEPLVAWRRYANSMSYGARLNMLARWSRRFAGFREHPSAMLQPVLRRVECAEWHSELANPKIRLNALAHWHARCSLPLSRIRRLPIVVRELVTGRYHGFSRGMLTAAKDLFLVR